MSAGLAFVGGSFAIFGEFDDAPGLILIGLLLGMSSAYINFKNQKKSQEKA